MKSYLNLGCGDRFHPDWTNVDISPLAPGIIKHDLSRQLPFGDNQFEVIYLSHVLEHFDRSAGLRLLAECYRVCTPGGVIRVVVPDLEMIVRLYIKYLENTTAGNEDAVSYYDWIMLELYDQMVRVKTQGEIAPFVRQSAPELAGFLKGRLGAGQYAILRQTGRHQDKIIMRLARLSSQPSRLLIHLRSALTQLLMLLLWGGVGSKIAQEVLFRQRGEIHRWMYDRFSLSRSLMQSGFQRTKTCSAHESQIENWTDFNLDLDLDGSIYKPDSLFCEGIKP